MKREIRKKNKTGRINSRGFTLIELMISISIFVILAVVVFSPMLDFVYRDFKAMRLNEEVRTTAKKNFNMIVRELKQSSPLSPNSIVVNATGDTVDFEIERTTASDKANNDRTWQHIRYIADTQAGRLTRSTYTYKVKYIKGGNGVLVSQTGTTTTEVLPVDATNTPINVRVVENDDGTATNHQIFTTVVSPDFIKAKLTFGLVINQGATVRDPYQMTMKTESASRQMALD